MKLVTYRASVEAAARLGVVVDDHHERFTE